MNGISRLVHVDAYRIDDEADLLSLELDTELLEGKTMMVLEWPEHASRWIRRVPHLRLTITLVT